MHNNQGNIYFMRAQFLIKVDQVGHLRKIMTSQSPVLKVVLFHKKFLIHLYSLYYYTDIGIFGCYFFKFYSHF